MYLRLEGLIQNSVTRVILNVLPTSIAVPEMDSRSRETNGSTEPRKIPQIKINTDLVPFDRQMGQRCVQEKVSLVTDA